MMLLLRQVRYLHPDKELLFEDIQLSIQKHDKIALIGNNGSGKSTLLQIMAGERVPASGQVIASVEPYYIPQIFGQFNTLSIARALRIDHKLKALQDILAGEVSEENLVLLDEDWTIEDRCREALRAWGLADLDWSQPMSRLSGGQKTRVFLAGIALHQPDLILLDEPSNHLDSGGRQLLYDFIRSTSAALVVVSHDRTLLDLPDQVYELSSKGLKAYGGNYSFYCEQKGMQANALLEDLRSKEKALRKARDIARESAERKQKLDARGKKKQEKAGIPTIAMNTLRNKAEKSSARLQDVHSEKTALLARDLGALRRELPEADQMKLDFDPSSSHKGKTLLRAEGLQFSYGDRPLWKQALSFEISSTDRVALQGPNGSGKTTLIRLLLGQITAQSGILSAPVQQVIYIDQDYSLIRNELSVYEQAVLFNHSHLREHELRIRLSRFLFSREDCGKSCSSLSGGERMRLMLCCLHISRQAPELIILDEPTNNLDLQNVEILAKAMQNYAGALLVVSHDRRFLEELGVEKFIPLE